MRKEKFLILSSLLSLSALLSGGVMAQTAMQASAKMSASCEISSATVNFGNLSSLKINTYSFQEFTFEVLCSNGAAYKINDTQRGGELHPMTGAVSGISNILYYGLSRKSSNNSWENFGLASQGTSQSIISTGTGVRVQHSMRAHIYSKNALATPDAYSANTTVELAF